jgi:hypothetical protein
MRPDGPGQSALLLLDVVDVLRAHGTEYAVIGAMAAAVYGSVRASLDADAVLRAGLVEARTLRDALAEMGAEVELRSGEPEDPIPGLLQVSDAFGNRVDLLIGLRGLESGAFQRTRTVEFLGTGLQFISREDFIAMKLFAAGPRDVADAQIAYESDAASVDLVLLRQLAGRFGSETAQRLDELLKSTGR